MLMQNSKLGKFVESAPITNWVFLPVVLFVPLLFEISSIGYYLGYPVTKYHFILGLLLSHALAFQCHELKHSKDRMYSFAITLGIISLGLILNGYFYDILYDSRNYHFTAIRFLIDGWNPILDTKPCQSLSAFLCKHSSIYVEHYPKGYWINAAAMHKFFGSVASTKLTNFVLIISSTWISFHFFRTFLKLSIWLSILFGVLWNFNPTSIMQLFSNYIDGAHVAGLSILFFTSLLYIVSRRILWLCLLLLYLPFVINLKFTGLVYSVVLGTSVMAYGIYTRRNLEAKKLSLYVMLITLIGLFGFGFNPYFVNSVEKNNMFYPAVRYDSHQDVLNSQASPEFIAKNRFEKLFISLFSYSSKESALEPQWDIPLSRIDYWPTSTIRFSGNGPWFSGCLLLCIPLLFFLTSESFILLGGILASIFITNAAWYSRLAPQIWWIPIIILAFSFTKFCHGKDLLSKCMKIIAWLTIVLLFGNSLLVMKSVYSEQYTLTKNVKFLIQKNKKRITGFTNFDPRFELYASTLLRDLVEEPTLLTDCGDHSTFLRADATMGIHICAQKLTIQK